VLFSGIRLDSVLAFEVTVRMSIADAMATERDAQKRKESELP